MGTILQDMMGMLSRKKVVTPKADDYISLARYASAQERLKPNPKVETELVTMKAVKAFTSAGLTTSPLSVENTSVSGTYAIDLSKDNHELTLTGDTTLSAINLPTLGKTIVVTLYVSSTVAETLTIPAGWTQYGSSYAADTSRNQIALSVSNNAVSGVVFDLSISNSN